MKKINAKKITAFKDVTYAVAKETLKNFMLAGIQTLSPAIPVQRCPTGACATQRGV